MTPEQIQEMIETGLPDCSATVVSDDNTHSVGTPNQQPQPGQH